MTISKYSLLVIIIHVLAIHASSQTTTSAQPYTQIKGYVSIIHSIVTLDKNGSAFNFSHSYTVGFPMGINIFKSEKIGFSFEVVPTIKVANDTDKVNNFIFHPGIIYRYKNGFSFITRLAFETSGRYGFTPIFNKVIIKRPFLNYFIAGSLPVRFGNEKLTSVGVAFQVGIVF